MLTTAVTNHHLPHLFLAPPQPPISRTLLGVKRQFHPSLRSLIRSLCVVSCLPPSSSSSTPRTRFIPSTKLFISGLSFRTTEESLRNAFKNFGELVEVNLVMDKIANRPRGFAFLRYATEEESKKAIEGMHGKVSSSFVCAFIIK
ncbi:glycine-rich RNA-binding 4, mitochondrial [Olea europaea subsp. europaea]|uniref:Glycine-rich RNA-binding 4, mitochondrial n=1 Tax=Olea europaea subsp. europaea TaxID=158383 RepID=A0A8S0ULQ9_OLEEU|nr:glycine-rich RNA-binding 4, mitochondrial [Olea europaea subsp. europaea]